MDIVLADNKAIETEEIEWRLAGLEQALAGFQTVTAPLRTATTVFGSPAIRNLDDGGDSEEVDLEHPEATKAFRARIARRHVEANLPHGDS